MPRDRSVSWWRVSAPSSSKMQSQHSVAFGAYTAKFVESADQVEPRG
jgi:hypothetical protein